MGPPVLPELTEQLAAQVDSIVDFIDADMPRVAARLKNSPHLIFLLPELAAAVSTEMTNSVGLDASAGAAFVIEALTEGGDTVFSAPSIEQILADTEGTATFWNDWGDFFTPVQRDVVSTLLIKAPVRWRDRVSGLAYRYLEENREQMSTEPEAMDNFIVWLWQEVQRQVESEAFVDSGVGGALDFVSKPYYAAQGFVTSLYNNIVEPDDVAWRNALTPGQTVAISMGADPSEDGWTWKSGTIDFFGTFILDPINVAAGVGFGAKTARSFPIMAEAAQKSRFTRALRTAVPLAGRRNAANLPVGTRSTWQRIGFHLFAKEADKLVEARRFQSLYDDIAKHFKARPNDYAGLVDRFPALRALMGEKGGGLVKINSTDPQAVKEGFLALLTQNSDTVIRTVDEAEKTLEAARAGLRSVKVRAFKEGSTGVDDLDGLDYVASAGTKVVDSPYGESRHLLITDPQNARDKGARLVWTSEPRVMNMRDAQTQEWFTQWMLRGGDSADEATLAARTPQAAVIRRTEDALEVDFVGPVQSQVASEFEQLVFDVRADPAGDVASNVTEVLTGRHRVAAIEQAVAEKLGPDLTPNWTRRVRILVDPDTPLASLPEDVANPLRLALYGAIPEGLSYDEGVEMVDELLKAAMQSGRDTIESVTKANAAKGLPPLYTGLGVYSGTEGVQTARTGSRTRSRLFFSPDIRAAYGGEAPLDITEPFGLIFPDSLPAVSDPALAYGGFDDLGRQSTGLKPPVEFIVYNSPGQPNMINLGESSEFARDLIREQFKFLSTPQQKDVFPDGWDAYVRNSVNVEGLVDEVAFEMRRFRDANPNAEPEEAVRKFKEIFFDIVDDRAASFAEDVLVDDFVEAFSRQFPDRQVGVNEVAEVKENYLAAYARELRNRREDVASQLTGLKGEQLWAAERGQRAIDFNFLATSEALFDDVVHDLADADDLAQVARSKVYRSMLIQHQLDALVDKAARGNWSDATLLHEFHGLLVSSGMEGERINRTMRHIQRQFAKNFDGAILPRGGVAGMSDRMMNLQERKAFLEARRQAWAEIDEQFGPIAELSKNDNRRYIAARDAVERQLRLQQQVNLSSGQNPIYMFFPQGGKRTNTFKVRPGYAKDEMHLAFTVPADVKTRVAMQQLYDNEVFLDLPPKAQARLINELSTDRYLGAGVGPSGSLDLPAQGLGIDEYVDESGQIVVKGLTVEDQPGYEALRPRELPDTGDIDLTDPNLRPPAPRSLDAPGVTPPENLLGDPTANQALANLEAPSITPQGEQLSLNLGEAPAPRDFPPVSQDTLDQIVRAAEGKGYDAIALPGGYQVITPSGRTKTQLVKTGRGSGSLSQELADAKRAVIKAESDLTWTKAQNDTRFTGLKSMPELESFRLSHMFSDMARKVGTKTDLDGHAARTARRFKAGFMDQTYPEGIDITNTQIGYRQLRSFLRHMGVRPSSQHRYLNRYIDSAVSERWGVLSDIVDEVAQEIDHPLLRAGLSDWSASGGLQSYSPTVADGVFRERTLRNARTRPGVATSPARPGQLSRIYPMPPPSYYQMLTRYRRGKALPARVKFLSTIGGKTKARVASGRNIARRLGEVDPALYAGMSDEEALLIGYANLTDPETLSALTKAVRSVGGGLWKGAHRAFTRVQLAARPFTWFFRVVLFDEMARGALLDTTSLYRHPFEYTSTLIDSYRLAQTDNYLATYTKLVNDEVIQLFAGIDNADDAMRAARQVVPDLPSLAGDLGFETLDSVDQVRNAMFTALRLDLDDATNYTLNLDRFGNRLRRVRRKAVTNQRRLSKYDLPADFDIRQLNEIKQQGLSNAVLKQAEATFEPIEWKPGLMNQQQRRIYGRAYATQLHGFATDPWGRIAIKDLAAIEAGAKSDAASMLVSSPYWNYMKREIIDVAQYNGVELGTDAELARYWLDNVLVPEARELLSPLFEGRLREGAMSILSGRGTANVAGTPHDLRVHPNFPGDLIDVIEDVVVRNPNHNFPPRIAASFDIRYALAQQDKNVLLRASDWAIETFGERATQSINRRPAWIRTYRDELRYLRSRGFGALDGLDAASNEKREWVLRRMAETSANRRINHVYFNMKDVPHYVAQMNKVIPFFSAMYEVSTSWGYKVPMAMSPVGWTSGAAAMGRKIDRFLQGLIRSGLIEVDDEPDEGSLTRSRQLSLRIATDLPSNVQAAEAASAGLRALMKGPELIVKWLGNLTTTIDTTEDPFPHMQYRVGVGNPVDPGAHGFGSALQLSAGLNPLGSFFLGEVRRRTTWGADAQKADFSSDDTLGTIAERYDMSVNEFLNWNSDLLLSLGVFSQLDINEHMRGVADLSERPLGRDVSLRIPNSTVMGTILDEVFFPFDQVESGVGVLNGFAPSWANFFLRGLGLHNATGEDTPWQMTEDGEIVFDFVDTVPGGLANIWVNVMVPPETRVFMAGNITEALQHLEATEGVLTTQLQWAEQYNALHEQFIAQGGRGIVGDNGRLEPLETSDPRLREMYDQMLALQTQMETHNSMIIKRATEIAAFNGFVRGLAGFLGPANPRTLYSDAQRRELYYNSRDAVEEARLTGSELTGLELPEIGGVTDAAAFFTMANLWYNDTSGDAAKTWFRDQYPEVAPFLSGKTYWGPGGEPVESESYTEYVEQVRRGERRPYPPEIATILQLKTAASIQREVDLINTYGNDPLTALQQILSNYDGYRKAQSDYQLQTDYIDVLDQQIFGGAYRDWADREEASFPIVQDELYRLFDDATRDLELAQQALETNPLLDDAIDVRNAAEDLEAAARGLRDIRRQFQIEGDWKKNPREELLTQYFDEVLAPYWEQRAEFSRRLNQPGMSSEDRSRVFTEMRIWENRVATTPLYLTNRDGTSALVPNPLDYRAGNSEPGEQRVYANRNLITNPRWNNLYDNQQLTEFYPRLAAFLPVELSDMEKYDRYDMQLLDVDQRWERGEISTSEKNEIKDALEEQFRQQLRTQGKPNEEFFMMDATPAERLHYAGVLNEWPLLTQYAAAVREQMDAAIAADESPLGKYTEPAFKNLLAHMKQQWTNDIAWRERFIGFARDLGYEQVFLDEFFNQFFLGKFTGDL